MSSAFYGIQFNSFTQFVRITTCASTILLVLFISTQAQQLSTKPINQVKVDLEPGDRISVDRLGGFYISANCSIEKFDTDGNRQVKYHPRGCTPVELVEAWNPFRIYAFEKSNRSFLILDREMQVIEKMPIDSAVAIEPLLATPSNDNRSYWLLDVDYSVKKVDLFNSKVLFETEPMLDVNKQYHFLHMREFQNFVFLLEENEGIIVLNSVGKLVKKIPAKRADYFSVLGEDIYFLKDNQIHFIDIYTEETYTVTVPTDTKFVVATDERLVLMKEKSLEVYAFTPKQ